jgi:hypothetical protein
VPVTILLGAEGEMTTTRQRFTILLTIALAAGCSSDEPRTGMAASSEVSDSITPQLPEVAAELIGMAQADQEARRAVFTVPGGPQALDTAALRQAAARLDSLDRAHTARLKEIIRVHGWPTRARVGREGARAAFLIVQHADRDRAFQEEYLAYLDSAVATGDAPGEALALLTDRIRVAKGEPQLYGTQVTITPDGPAFPPIEDSLHVDERRAALGMPPLAEYRALLEQTYRQAQTQSTGTDKGSD